MGIDKKSIYISLLLIIFSFIGMYFNQDPCDVLYLNIFSGIFTSSFVTLGIFITQFYHKRSIYLKESYLKIQSMYQSLDYAIELVININRIIKNQDDKYLLVKTSEPYINKDFMELCYSSLNRVSSKEINKIDFHNEFNSFFFDKEITTDLNQIYGISVEIGKVGELFSNALNEISTYEIDLLKRKIDIRKEEFGCCNSNTSNFPRGINGKKIKSLIENDIYNALIFLRRKLENINMSVDKKALSFKRYSGYTSINWEDVRKMINKENKNLIDQVLDNIRRRTERNRDK